MGGADLAQVFLQGAADYAAGRLGPAEAAARAVLAGAPGHVRARHLLAACRAAAGALDEAGAELAAVLAAEPGDDEVRLQLAALRARQGRPAEVVALLAEEVRRRPEFVAAYRPLAAALWETRARGAAIEVYRGLVARAPQDGAAHRALGDALRLGKAHAEALPLLRRAVALLEPAAPGDPQAARELLAARVGLAETLAELAMAAAPAHAEAAAAARAAREMGVANPDVLVRIAVVLNRAGEYDAADECYAAALDRAPGHAEARMHRAMLRMLRGDLAGGWPDYEMRRHRPGLRDLLGPPPAQPWTAPARLDGQTVRVVLEQGAGDTLHFARYLPLLAARGARVEVAAAPDSPLRPLLAAMPAVAGFVAAFDAPGDPAAVVPLLSLPLAFGTRADGIPAWVPYLTVPPERRRRWRARLEAGDLRPRVGVVWWGNPEFANDRQRSIPLAHFAPVLARDDIAFHVLAPRLREGEEAQGAGLATVHEGIADFADTAALAEALDLVIAVDTAAAHLAGALARPVWVLLPHDPDWRWMLGREDSPWYPTARLFRQAARGDWDGVIARVREALDATFG